LLELLKQKVLLFLHCYLDFWSKEQSDLLVLYCSTDYKIELTDDKNLEFSYLNKHSLEELTAMQEYLTDNFSKSFIVNSKAPFAFSILFVCKADRLLQFCINYCKLNAITKKNRYSFLLIDETLACLAKAKIFIKLDIY
jgi:hypothetical protein